MRKRIVICIVVIMLVLLTASTALAGTASYSGRALRGWTSTNWVAPNALYPELTKLSEYCDECYTIIVHDEVGIDHSSHPVDKDGNSCSYATWEVGYGDAQHFVLNAPVNDPPLDGKIHIYIKNIDYLGQYTMRTSGSFISS